MKIESSVELKKVHAKDIVEYLRKNKDCTKKLMTKELGFSFATISNICNELRERGYIREAVLDDVKVVGRNPMEISLNYENLLCLCLDLTVSESIRAAVMDYGRNMVYSEDFAYPGDSGAKQVVEVCREIYEQHILRKISPGQIIGVGVAVPGIFERKSRNIVSSEIEIFNDQPLKAMLEEALGKSVYIDNESNLCVLSRYRKADTYREEEDIIYIFADEGLGIGVVSGGTLVRGSGGYAPEICHMPIGNMRMKCHLCSSMGCVESDLRMEGYVEKYRLFAADSREKGEVPPKDIHTWEEFENLAAKGDDTARKVLEENGEIFGKLLSVLNNMFNPDCIYIGGKTASVIKDRLEGSMRQVRARLLAADYVLPRLCLDSDSGTTALKGASEMVFAQWMPL